MRKVIQKMFILMSWEEKCWNRVTGKKNMTPITSTTNLTDYVIS